MTEDDVEDMEIVGMGWLPDFPDHRDYDIDTAKPHRDLEDLGQKGSINGMIKRIGMKIPKNPGLPRTVNLTRYCSKIEDQGSIGSCTAQAGVGILEYFERKAKKKHIEHSRLFLYKVTRNLLHLTGDTGAYLRTTMAAMRLFGVPPEEHWKYRTSQYDVEPSAFCYAFAKEYQAIQYFRLDPPGVWGPPLRKRVKMFLAHGIPSMFGFSVFSSYTQARNDGEIPFPSMREKRVGGHAVVAVGYDDRKRIKNNINNKTTTGAFLIRNSWGRGWGQRGYGWLPYSYVDMALARDFWSLLKNEWVDLKVFGLEK
jgi:C1A family cysteine protease